MIEKNLDTVLVLEDDVRFEYNFKNNFREVMNDARQLVKEGLDWDLMYVLFESCLFLSNSYKFSCGVYGYSNIKSGKTLLFFLGVIV